MPTQMRSDNSVPELIFGAVADDLTGGVELASGLVSGGVRTGFLIGVPDATDAPDGEAVVVALKSRVAPAQDVMGQMSLTAKWLAAQKARQIFFKYCATFDSTDEGNIGCSADVLMEATNADRLIFCPAFPQKQRTIYNGHMFVGDVLLSNSAKRHDPLTPMTDPDLRAVLARQTQRLVGHLPKSVTDLGLDAMTQYVDHMVQTGKSYLIADAIDDADLARIAAFTLDWSLMSGNTTVAIHYPALWRRKGLLDDQPPPIPITSVKGPGAVIIGSVAEQSLAQLEAFRAAGNPVLRIDLQSGTSTDQLVSDVLEWAGEHLDQREFAISTAVPANEVKHLQEKIGRRRSADIAEEILSRVAAELVARGVQRLVVAGGETSGAVVQALKLKKLIVGPQPKHGIPLAQASIDGRTISLSLKSGKLGEQDVFAERLHAMLRGVA